MAEAGFGWWYPPGCPGAHTVEVDVKCPNCGEVSTKTAVKEFGWLEFTSEKICYWCKTELREENII